MFFAAHAAAAQAPEQLKVQGYVSDFAGVLSPAVRDQLTALCTEVDQKAQAQIAVVTIKSLGGRAIEEYSLDLATRLGIGPKASNRGVLILLAVDDGRVRPRSGPVSAHEQLRRRCPADDPAGRRCHRRGSRHHADRLGSSISGTRTRLPADSAHRHIFGHFLSVLCDPSRLEHERRPAVAPARRRLVDGAHDERRVWRRRFWRRRFRWWWRRIRRVWRRVVWRGRSRRQLVRTARSGL
ncbi:MAG: TPM domain-containing protein [Acidobacteriia bacterium]|nr:TPM domain-containing protein [Terriglobia bacterium]